jgi:hypothetical protein
MMVKGVRGSSQSVKISTIEAKKKKKLQLKEKWTYVIEHGLHERDRDLGLLDEVVLCILDLEPGGLLLRRACGLESENRCSISPIILSSLAPLLWSHATHMHRHTTPKDRSTYTCFALSNSNRLVLTANLAFIATSTEFVRVFLQGARNCDWIAASCCTRASATFSHAPAYCARALASRSSPVALAGACWSSLVAVVAARPRACGRVLCCTGEAWTGAGAGRLVPLRLVAAKFCGDQKLASRHVRHR